MLKLRDFILLPQVDDLVKQIVDDEPGMILLAGIEARKSTMQPSEGFRASGLTAIFNILIQEILLAHPHDRALIVASDRLLAKLPRQFNRRVQFARAEPPFSYPGQIELAMVDHPGLLVIDRLTEEGLPAAMRAACTGMRVLTMYDTVLCGASVARQLVEQGAPQEHMRGLRWIVTNQRVPVLCERCRQQVDEPGSVLEQIRERFPHLKGRIDSLSERLRREAVAQPEAPSHGGKEKPLAFYRAGGCKECGGTGYHGDVGVFDLYRNDPAQKDPRVQRSMLSLEEYSLHLAAQGSLDLFDLLDLENAHLRRVYQLLASSERALAETNSTLTRKLFELEASNRVLVQRTEVLMSLQDLGQALITSTDLNDLAARICRRAGELCGADRVVLYLRRIGQDGHESAEILSERGWGLQATGQRLDAKDVFGVHSAAQDSLRAARYVRVPPGFRTEGKGAEGSAPEIKTGVNMPLFAQTQLVGSMFLQSTQKEFFSQGEMALLNTFANQAALAIQRAGLVEELRAKIQELQAAQAELVQKERMERELELARQVQQSMLPHSFPEITGYSLAARNEPARQVGGDFYDVIHLDADHFGVVVADVSDKGLPAALYMSLTRSLLLAEARRTLSPRETLQNVNRLLQEVGELDGFVSVFYGVVEVSTRRMSWTRAGHERPLLLRSGEATQLGGEGTVLGIMEGDALRLTEESVNLLPGDTLVLYTDGLTDVLDSLGHFSGVDHFHRMVKGLSGKSAGDVCDLIFTNLTSYRGDADQFDDMTLLVLQVRGEDQAP